VIDNQPEVTEETHIPDDEFEKVVSKKAAKAERTKQQLETVEVVQPPSKGKGKGKKDDKVTSVLHLQ
jgi:hypothetical protein